MGQDGLTTSILALSTSVPLLAPHQCHIGPQHPMEVAVIQQSTT